MKLLFRLFLPAFMLTVLCTPLFSQESGEEDDDEAISIASEQAGLASVYSRGDRIFNIQLGLVFPLFYYDTDRGKIETNMKMGGTASLGYTYFFTPHFFIGGEVSGMFAPTIGKNMYYSVPFGFRTGWQFILRRFEIPLSLMIGFAPQSYMDASYFGFFAKPSAGIYFRVNPEWSFGLQSAFWIVPQWSSKNELDNNTSSTHGFFWDISVGVRYHF
jgi:hypothetical protein